MIAKTCSKCGGWQRKVGEFIEWNGPTGTLPPRRCRCDETLTFAEAMALDPSEVECRNGFAGNPAEWKWKSLAGLLALADNLTPTLKCLRRLEFRRSRPKRSRVQEMAEDWRNNRLQEPVDGLLERAIRAVCEYLKTCPTVAEVERYFLEPRT